VTLPEWQRYLKATHDERGESGEGFVQSLLQSLRGNLAARKEEKEQRTASLAAHQAALKMDRLAQEDALRVRWAALEAESEEIFALVAALEEGGDADRSMMNKKIVAGPMGELGSYLTARGLSRRSTTVIGNNGQEPQEHVPGRSPPRGYTHVITIYGHITLDSTPSQVSTSRVQARPTALARRQKKRGTPLSEGGSYPVPLGSHRAGTLRRPSRSRVPAWCQDSDNCY